MEQGKLSDAVEAYQQMMNLKPDLRAYARAAHMRWLKGDLDGSDRGDATGCERCQPAGCRICCMGEHAIGHLPVLCGQI